MNRILPLLAVPASLLALFAASACSSKSNNTATQADGAPATTAPSDGGAPAAPPGANPIEGITAADPYTSETIANLSSFLDGPTWSVARNSYLFTAPEQTEGFVFRLDLNGLVGPTRKAEAPNRTVGQAVDPTSGDVISVVEKAVQRTPVPEGVITDPATVATICTAYDPATNPPSTDPFDPSKAPPPGTGAFDALNDVVIGTTGNIYFTDPGYNTTPESNRVFFLPAGASVAKIVASYPNLDHPNGIALSPDQHTLYVSFTTPHEKKPFIGKFAVADDGSIDNTKAADTFAETGDGSTPDGLAIDVDGNVYAATATGVNVYKPDGTPWGTISVGVAAGSTVTGLTFGGPNLTTLFITTGGASGVGGLFKAELKVKGNPQ